MPTQIVAAAVRPVEAPLAMEPVRAGERIEVLDVLRGFAVFGILWMNMPWGARPDNWYDRGFEWIGEFLAAGKFYTLFSFLFGLGFAVQLSRAEARGARIAPLYARRLLVLLLIGLAHVVFLWNGDILRDYAILGFLLLLFRARSPRTLLAFAALSLSFAMFWEPLIGAIRGLPRPDAEAARTRALDLSSEGVGRVARAEPQLRHMWSGTYAENVAHRARMLRMVYSRWRSYFDGSIFCMFLLGLWAGRRGIFDNVAAHVPLIRRVMWWGLLAGVTGNLASVVGGELSDRGVIELSNAVTGGFWFVGAPALCLFYASGIILLMQKAAWQRRLRPLAKVGRMALSNYLLQSVIFTTLFYGYALGPQPRLSAAAALPLTVIIFAAQIPLSTWWLRRFQFGPMEWVWRTLTYGKRQPMRAGSR